eukprot:351596-Chlamydomonas_euryale.AAC.14
MSAEFRKTGRQWGNKVHPVFCWLCMGWGGGHGSEGVSAFITAVEVSELVLGVVHAQGCELASAAAGRPCAGRKEAKEAAHTCVDLELLEILPTDWVQRLIADRADSEGQFGLRDVDVVDGDAGREEVDAAAVREVGHAAVEVGCGRADPAVRWCGMVRAGHGQRACVG